MNNTGFFPNNPYPGQTIVPEQGTNPNQEIGLITNQGQIKNSHVDYADNIFLLNKGHIVTVYFSYPDSIEWRDKTFTGTIVDAGRDYLLIRDTDGKNILLWLIYINYAIFNEDIIHNYN